MPLRLAYFADDFTGSTDALEFLARAGWRAMLFTRAPAPQDLGKYGELDAVGVAGHTRSLPPDEMERVLGPAFESMRALRPAYVHYKVCSTFDSSPTIGSIGRAMEVGATAFPGAFVPLVVGAPALGRYCVFGNLFARFGIGSTGAIHRLDRHPAMSRHPVTPADEADLRLHLRRQTKKRIELVDVLTLEQPLEHGVARLGNLVSQGAEVVLFDALTSGHLERIGALLAPFGNPERPFFCVGSSAIEMVLGSLGDRGQPPKQPPRLETAGPCEPLLVVSGSCSPVTVGQLRWAEKNGFAMLALEPAEGANDATVVAAAGDQLRRGVSVVVHTSPPGLAASSETGRASSGVAQGAAILGTRLGRLARELVMRCELKRVVIAGGDTSSYAARALGVEALEIIAPLAPGAPLCRVHADGTPLHGLEINFKGGQVGAEDYFGAVARGKL